MSLITIGISLGHDCGCALVRDGQVVVAVSEERLNRHKYSGGWQSSLTYCLDAANVGIGEIDLFAISGGGKGLPDAHDRELVRLDVDPERIVVVDHHLSHAAGAFCLSGFDSAAVVVFDAVGNHEDTESAYVADRSGITRLRPPDPARPRYKGIGSTYEAFTNFLGFNDEESGKTMALAAYGDPEHFPAPLFDLESDRVMAHLEQTHHWGVREFARKHGLDFGEPFPDSRSPVAQHVAAYVQSQSERAIRFVIEDVLRQTGATRLCISGGVALNCVANTKMCADFPGVEFYFLPAASDCGQPLGNALLAYFARAGVLPPTPTDSCEFGRRYDDESVLRALEKFSDTLTYGRLYRYQHHFTRESNPPAAAAQLLAEGKTVAWFQGGSELGPRALGHRSILADPRRPEMREHLNRTVKHREWFRPFAPSILADHSPRYTGDQRSRPFMIESPAIVPECRADIAAAVHVDGSARVQDVGPQGMHLRPLLQEFGARTGVFALLNTSFNIREPIVETPGQALGTFLSSELDYLMLGSYLVSKVPNE